MQSDQTVNPFTDANTGTSAFDAFGDQASLYQFAEVRYTEDNSSSQIYDPDELNSKTEPDQNKWKLIDLHRPL